MLILTLLIITGFVYLYKKINSVYDSVTQSLKDNSLLDEKQFKYLSQLLTNPNNVSMLSLPIGSVVTYTSNTVPEDYMVCDGSVLNISDYESLFSVIGTTFNQSTIDANVSFNIPDLRGLFIRGVDAQRAIGSMQNYSTALPTSPFSTDSKGSHSHVISSSGSHSHTTTLYTGLFLSGNVQSYTTKKVSDGPLSFSSDISGNHTHDMSSSPDHSHIISSGGDTETRPVNIGLSYIIKVK